MPELPEVETARAAIERAALRRRIVEVDDTDAYECRPHRAGEIRSALVGRRLTGAFRKGKSMWCETSGVDRSRRPGPALGIHLGMSGRILVSDGNGSLTEGGDWPGGRYGAGEDRPGRKAVWDRFRIVFDDGGDLRLFDKRRLGRVLLDPDLDALGPDAELVGLAEFRTVLAGSRAPVKARLLDQSAIAGVGNLLADETLWQARIRPSRRCVDLVPEDVATLHRGLRAATKAAIRQGGVHTGAVVPFRHAGATCPRCGSPMTRATVGGRTTWWCPVEQV